MHRALLATTMTLAATLAPTGAQAAAQGSQRAHHHCRPTHGPRFCAAVEQRRAIKRLRPLNISQERRSGRPHHRYLLSWNLPRLWRQNHHLRRRIHWLRSLPDPHPTTVVGAVCALWHPCDAALRVFRCESGLTTTAQNGQYLGLAQMGYYARSRYGHGSDAWTQARAAHAYYMDAGWRPWECAYITGVL